MTSKPTLSDIYDINKKTGALILGKNRLEDYATKYLNKHCKEALEKPMPLPVEKILSGEKLEVKEVSLSREFDIFGCCMLISGQVNVYDKEADSYHLEMFPERTILFDPKSEAMYGEGAKRNTLMHEAIHWEKDKKYFEILKLKNRDVAEKLYPILCRSSKTFYEPPEGKKTKENEVRWLEWQAHRLAPRILMPYEMFRKKAQELMEEGRSGQSNMKLSCDGLIEALSEFFIVSRASVKFRLLEVGLKDAISKYDDYEAIYEEITASKEYIQLTPIEAYELLREESSIYDWVSGGRFVYADGYFVLANKEYVSSKGGEIRLTAKAKRNLEKCVLNIREQKYKEYPNFHKDCYGYSVLFHSTGIDHRLYYFHPNYQANLNKLDSNEVYDAAHQHISTYDEETEIEIYKCLGDPTKSLCQCLMFIMESQGCDTSAKFNHRTLLHKNYYGDIKNNKKNDMTTKVLMAICVGMRLNLRLTEEVFDRSENKLKLFQNPDKTYIRIMETFPGLSINDFNEMLKREGIEELGTEYRVT